MERTLKGFLGDLKALRREVKANQSDQIARKALREQAEQLGTRWFSDIAVNPTVRQLPAETLDKYASACTKLIKLSAPNNLKKSYLATLDSLIRSFRDDLVIPIQQSPAGTIATGLDGVIAALPNDTENDYLQEALACGKQGFLRAAVVLGWCAAIDRIHRKIDELGYPRFNVASATMAGQSKGRFKRFNQTQNIGSLSELRQVFDTTVLWIVEGMGLIDINQHTRLRSCFDMRCHSAHPGEAPITEYNVMSFFSDLDQIVFRNKTFELSR